MLCPNCKAEIPDDSVTCSSCGAKVSGEAPAAGPGALSTLSLLVKADPAGFLILIGSFFIILGAFLPWGTELGPSLLGVSIAQGAAILIVGVLLLATLMLARSGAAGAWGVVMFLLCALALALVFQTIYTIGDSPYARGAGVWLAMAGALVIAAGIWRELRGAPKT